jgi:ribosome biogenesis GTPase A
VAEDRSHPVDGLMLAASHAVGVNAYIDEEVGTWLAGFLLEHYPALLTARYGFDLTEGLDAVACDRGDRQKAWLHLIKGRGGELDLEKAARPSCSIDYRTGALGRISLETPTLRAARARELKLKGPVQDDTLADAVDPEKD